MMRSATIFSVLDRFMMIRMKDKISLGTLIEVVLYERKLI